MRVYSPNPLPSQDIYPLFFFRYAPKRNVGGLFVENIPTNYFETDVVYVERPEDAQSIIVPNNFTSTGVEEREYIAGYADVASKLNIPIFLFSCGDYSHTLKFDPRVYVFRHSLYKSAMSSMDISTPTLTSDIGLEGISLRPKTQKPTVSFCGKAGFSSPRERVASYVRMMKYEIAGLILSHRRAYVRGIFWRRRAMRACLLSDSVTTRFILRKTFSGALRTIEVLPKQARKEFLDSIIESDFVLAPKGDGNYSNRFLEALSMGRIPVLIDTDTVLPMEGEIDYAQCVVRVPMHCVSETPRYIREFYDALNEEEWHKRQRMARDIFTTYLRQDSFFRAYFLLFVSKTKEQKTSLFSVPSEQREQKIPRSMASEATEQVKRVLVSPELCSGVMPVIAQYTQ